MQNAKRHELKKQGYSANQFNDAEYERWSEGITGTQSLKAQSGIESFLGMSKDLRSGREDVSEYLDRDRRKMKMGRIKSMVWKSHEWRRAVGKLQNRYRLLVVKLISAVSNEEASIARMELDGQLKNLAISPGGTDEEETRHWREV
jgi:hypothetical protein